MPFSIVEKILKAHNGARFVKADLHIHTPASNDWDKKNLDPQYQSTNLQPSQIIEAALNKDLDLIAITDHNSVEWCERMLQAADGTRLTVLPGFELTVRPGVHVLALFEPDIEKIDELRSLLIKLGIKSSQFGDPEAMTDDTVENLSSEFKVVREIQKVGGLVIPAHVDLDSGIVGRMKGGTAVKDFLTHSGCTILEVSNEIPPVIETMLRNNPNEFAIIRGSDAHQLQKIGCHPLWFKMDTPSLNGIKHIALEPLTRIQADSLDSNPKFQILGMYSVGGLLTDQVFSFSDDLNCLIGGRGAGKSAVIDYLRFVFENEPVDTDLVEKFRKRLVDLVRDSTVVYALVSDTEKNIWLYERTLSYETRKKGNRVSYEISSGAASIYQVLLDQQRTIKFEENKPSFRIQFFGQGEVQSITNTAEPARQLQLIDNFIISSIKQRQTTLSELESDFKNIEGKIIDIDEELEQLELEINQLDEIRTRVTEIETDLRDSRLQGHQIWEDVNNWIGKALKHIDAQKDKLDDINIESLEEKSFDIGEDDAQVVVNKILNDIQNILDLLQQKNAELKSEVETLYEAMKQTKLKWDNKYKKEEAEYTAALRKQGVENLATLNRELSQKKQQLDDIENKKKPRCQQIKQERDKLMRQRGKKLKELFDCWENIRDCRKQAAKEMTKRLSGDVVIRLVDERNLEAYYESLDEFAPGGIQARQRQIQKIIEVFTPKELVDIIRTQDTVTLINNAGITQNSATKLMQIDEVGLMQIERVRCDDIAEIKLSLENEEKSLSDLSEGEKCTAILSVILLDETCPLVIDQPEDELDHAFIMSNVVSTLSKVKQKNHPIDIEFRVQTGRQFVVATHNQNIPVLGDAELVFKMRKIPGENKCEFESAYGLEHPETIQHILSLEGGREAFERRRKKYSHSV